MKECTQPYRNKLPKCSDCERNIIITPPAFETFRKIPRFNRDVVITEKIDGTNAQICITEGGGFFVGSRNKWITPEHDNMGFAKWAYENKEELMKLGVGHHYGEWWGQGIQRNYGLDVKRFSLFNTSVWSDDEIRPACCSVVPVLYEGLLRDINIKNVLIILEERGSFAARGFMKPEGIVIFHTAAGQYFKITLENDEYHKGEIKE